MMSEKLAEIAGYLQGYEGDLILFSACALEAKNFSTYHKDMEAIMDFIRSTDLHTHITDRVIGH